MSIKMESLAAAATGVPPIGRVAQVPGAVIVLVTRLSLKSLDISTVKDPAELVVVTLI